MDPFLVWLEATPFSIWMRESTSLLAFPAILAVHTAGMGFVAGINAMLALRILGVGPGIPIGALRRFFPAMWLAFWLNAVSGVALLAGYPTKALTNPVFYLKLLFIAVALVVLARLTRLIAGPADENRRHRRHLTLLAVGSLACWAGAIFAGRFLAYTHTRLMATF
jgi:hypothetical protein